MIFLLLAILCAGAFAFSRWQRKNMMNCWHAHIFYYVMQTFYISVIIGCFAFYFIEPEQQIVEYVVQLPTNFKEFCIKEKDRCFPFMNDLITYMSAAMHYQKKFVLYCCDVISEDYQTHSPFHFCTYHQEK